MPTEFFPLPVFQPPAFVGRFGLARRDITPPLGIYARNWGASSRDRAESVHDALTVTALVIQISDGGPSLALVSLDLGWWRSEEEERLFAQAVREAGVAENCGIVTLSHTHSGPVFSPSLVDQPGGEKIPEYVRSVCAQIREALIDARNHARPGTWESVTGTCPLAQNRDLRDPEGARFLVGWNPEEPADQTLVVGRICDEAGVCLGTVVNYACHPTILAWENAAISPDYVGMMRQVVEAETGGFCLFLPGASGDLAPRHQYVGDPAVAEKAGRCLGFSVLALLYHLPSPGRELAFSRIVESGAPLAVWQEQPRTHLPHEVVANCKEQEIPIRDDLPSAEELSRQFEQCQDSFQQERLRRKILIRRAVGERQTYPARYLIWRLGGICVVASPNEIYSRMQGEVRKAAGVMPVYFVTLANGGRGYLVPESAYDENLYAMWQTPYARGSWEQCRDVLCAEVQRLTGKHGPAGR